MLRVPEVLIGLYKMIDGRVYMGLQDGNISSIRGFTATVPRVSLRLVNACEAGVGIVTTG